MKKLLVLFVIGAMTLSFWSCEKDEDEKDYVGTWQETYTDEGIQYKDVYTFTESTFESVTSVNMGTGFVEAGGAKGTMSVSGSTVTLTLTHAGLAEYDMETHTLGELMWYASGTPEFDAFIEDVGSATLNGEYSVSGDTMTMKIDSDGDGAYSADETSTLTKV